MKSFYNLILYIVFGKESLDGYYSNEEKKNKKNNYVYGTVFPSREIMEAVMESVDD